MVAPLDFAYIISIMASLVVFTLFFSEQVGPVYLTLGNDFKCDGVGFNRRHSLSLKLELRCHCEMVLTRLKFVVPSA
jgi:hypothetical protein